MAPEGCLFLETLPQCFQNEVGLSNWKHFLLHPYFKLMLAQKKHRLPKFYQAWNPDFLKSSLSNTVLLKATQRFKSATGFELFIEKFHIQSSVVDLFRLSYN